jgi:hypothetical protein|tara:strand:+ start:1058 stop:1564 length:507 start_codon:yes stop_codon:yes gene_type:complete
MENKKPKLEFQKEATYKVELLFDAPRQGKNNKGHNWYLYGVKHDEVEKNFFADYALSDELKKYSRGDVLEITDMDLSDNPWKHDWKVVSVGSNKPLDELMKSRNNKTEAKIEVFAAMKIAVSLSNNIDELQSNTYDIMRLHKKMVEEVINDGTQSNVEEVKDKIEELF